LFPVAQQNPSDLGFASVFKDENGILIITIKDHQKLDEIDVININLSIRFKAEGKPSLRLLDARAKWSMNKKARERAKLEHKATPTIARAIVVSSAVTAALMGFLKSFGKHNYPQRIFSDYEEAYAWLKSFTEDK
jgi:hypothetical protein